MHITALEIKNFRSLKNVRISDMRTVCIFHGLNNCGKSNILAAIDSILKGKRLVEATVVSPGTEQKVSERSSGFYTGRLDGFSDNFYLNTRDPILFKLDIDFHDVELQPWQGLIESIRPARVPKKAPHEPRLALDNTRPKRLSVSGEFRYVDEQSCDSVVTQVTLNSNFVIYRNQGETVEHVPSLQENARFDLAQRVHFFEWLMSNLTDSYQLIGTDRFLSKEVFDPSLAQGKAFGAESFKQFLFGLSTNRFRQKDFKRINERFSKEPFLFGELSFHIDPVSREIEIIIERSHVRLPLERMGSGLQQILFLIAGILSSGKRIVAVEEIELNLSPQAQKAVFEMLKAMVIATPRVIDQVLVTSHSPYFQGRNDVRYFEVSYNNTSNETEVKGATKTGLRRHFGGWNAE